MPTAFEILESNSDAPAGSTAWEFLNNPSAKFVQEFGLMAVELMAEYQVEFEENVYVVELESEYVVVLESNEFEVEIG